MESNLGDMVELHEGMDVVGVDGDKIGKIVAVDNQQIVVEKGFFFPSDHAIPMSAVEAADDDKVYLNVSKDQVLNQTWNTGTTSTSGTEYAASGTDYATGSADYAAGTEYATGTGRTSQVSGDDTLVVPVHEEELTATTRPVEAGQVEINKRVVSEQRSIDVPVTQERVRVTRRAVDRMGDAGEQAFQEGTIDVPLRGEQVEMRKQTRVAEEVEVGKEAVQSTQRVSGTVRREEVDVQDATGGSGGVIDSSSNQGKGLVDQAVDAVKDVAGKNKMKNR